MTGTVKPIDDKTLEQLATKSGDTVEHMKDMLNAADNPDTANQPKLYAGKYTSEDELQKGIENLIERYGKEDAYKILESSLGKQKTGTNPSMDNSINADTQVSEDHQKDALSQDSQKNDGEPGRPSDQPVINLEKYNTEFLEKGELSEDSYKELEKAGIPKEFVDQYIEGMQAKSNQWTTTIHEKAGGAEAYQELINWGAENLSDGEKNTFNEAINSGDVDKASLVLEALKARYERANGTMTRSALKPRQVSDGPIGVQGYQSVEEMKADMSDPRYVAQDQAFHKHVINRMKKTTIF